MTTVLTTTRVPTTVPRLCTTGTVVCLATGPSLTPEDVDYVRGKATVIAVNDAWKLAPWADVLYSSDLRWFPYYHWVPSFAGLKVTLDALENIPPDVVVLKHMPEDGVSYDPTGLRTGAYSGSRNSGAAAINLAVHLGARRIVLLGYDMAPTPDGQVHFFGHHPWTHQRSSKYQEFRRLIGTMVAPLAASGIAVVNCSRSTALECFPRQPLREVL